MKTVDVNKETKRCCRELNKMIPCKTQETSDEFARILDEYFVKCENSHLFWDTSLWLECGKDVSTARQKLMYSGEYKLYPSEDSVYRPGIFVKSKSSK